MDKTEQRCREILAQEVEASRMQAETAKHLRSGGKLLGWPALALRAMMRIADAPETPK